MNQQTLLLIKSNAVAKKHVGHILSMVEEHGFRIVALKVFSFTSALAAEFYKEHIGKEFYPRLEKFMCIGDTVAAILEKENAIAELRELLGSVEPEKRKPGTIRYLYGDGITDNGAHASDCPISAEHEIGVIFSD